MKRWLRCKLVLAALSCLSPQLPAYTVEPNMIVLGSGGRDSSTFLRLVNRETRPAAVEIVVNEFSRDLDGRGILGKEADEQFIVYPAQLILMPGDEASVQVRWIGIAQAGSEQTFALTTREVVIPHREQEPPAASEGARININVLMNYDVRVYVAPRGAKSKLTVEGVTVRAAAGEEQDLLEVTLANHGTAHQSLKEMSLVLTALDPDGKPLRPAVTMPAQDVPGMNTALLANGQRRLRIPWPAALPVGPVRVALSQ